MNSIKVVSEQLEEIINLLKKSSGHKPLWDRAIKLDKRKTYLERQARWKPNK